MRRIAVLASLVLVLLAVGSPGRAEPPALVPCDDLPPAVAALGSRSEIEAFALAPAASLALAAIRPTGDGGSAALRFARDGDSPHVVQLPGRILGLAVAEDGKLAYAVVGSFDRKGVARSVDLVRVDLATARAASVLVLPASARGLAVGADGASLLIACRNEIRTFRLPGLESGQLFRAAGDNVGVAPIRGTSFVLVAQPSRIVLADLDAPQGRDGLVLSDEAAAPARLRGMLASTLDAGPVALSEEGPAWCVRAGALPPPPPPENPSTEPVRVEPVAAEAIAAEPSPAEPAPVEPIPAAPTPTAPTPPVVPAPRDVPGVPGAVYGTISGPSVLEVAALVILGPDNVLHEAARAVPDEQGRFSFPALPTGAYRIVAAGKGGRVLICDPPYMTIRVGSNGAVEAPVLKVLRAQ